MEVLCGGLRRKYVVLGETAGYKQHCGCSAAACRAERFSDVLYLKTRRKYRHHIIETLKIPHIAYNAPEFRLACAEIHKSAVSGLHRRHSKRNSRLDHCVSLLHHGSRGRAVKAVVAYYRGLVLGRFVVLLYHQIVELGGELPVHKLHYIARTVFANVRKVLALALKQRSGVRAVLAVSLRREFSDIHSSRQEYQRFFAGYLP